MPLIVRLPEPVMVCAEATVPPYKEPACATNTEVPVTVVVAVVPLVIANEGPVGWPVAVEAAAPEPFKATLYAPEADKVPATALVEAASNLIVGVAGRPKIV